MPRGVSIGVHVFAAIIFLLLLINSVGMALFCLIPGALIAVGSWRAVAGRPIAVYAAFGVLMGFSFWATVWDINQGNYLLIVPTVFLVGSVALFLYEPNVGTATFFACVIVLLMGISGLSLAFPSEYPDEAEIARRSDLTALGLLAMGLAYGAVGFAEIAVSASKPARADKPVKRKRRRPTPLEPLDEDFGV